MLLMFEVDEMVECLLIVLPTIFKRPPKYYASS